MNSKSIVSKSYSVLEKAKRMFLHFPEETSRTNKHDVGLSDLLGDEFNKYNRSGKLNIETSIRHNENSSIKIDGIISSRREKETETSKKIKPVINAGSTAKDPVKKSQVEPLSPLSKTKDRFRKSDLKQNPKLGESEVVKLPNQKRKRSKKSKERKKVSSSINYYFSKNRNSKERRKSIVDPKVSLNNSTKVSGRRITSFLNYEICKKSNFDPLALDKDALMRRLKMKKIRNLISPSNQIQNPKNTSSEINIGRSFNKDRGGHQKGSRNKNQNNLSSGDEKR